MGIEENLHLIVAENIKTMRIARGLSQEAFADLCGLHRTYIGAIERGERNITLQTLSKLTRALGCSLTELFGVNK